MPSAPEADLPANCGGHTDDQPFPSIESPTVQRMRDLSGPSRRTFRLYLKVAPAHAVVVDQRRLQFLFGEQLLDVDNPAVSQVSVPWKVLVNRVVVAEVLALPFPVALTAIAETREQHRARN